MTLTILLGPMFLALQRRDITPGVATWSLDLVAHVRAVAGRPAHVER